MTTALEGGECGQQHASAVLYPRERPGTHCTGGWVGPGAGLDGRKIPPHRDSIPDRPAWSSVAIPTELPGPYQLLLLIHIVLARVVITRIRCSGCGYMRSGDTSPLVYIYFFGEISL